MRHFEFEKDPDSRWYVVLPEWKEDRAALEMVTGADTLLDIIAQGENRINVAISTEEFEGWSFKLSFLRFDETDDEYSGGWYQIEGNNVTPFECWLCPVMLFVFGEYPKLIYFK